jgi:hypothetical protein
MGCYYDKGGFKGCYYGKRSYRGYYIEKEGYRGCCYCEGGFKGCYSVNMGRFIYSNVQNKILSNFQDLYWSPKFRFRRFDMSA